MWISLFFPGSETVTSVFYTDVTVFDGITEYLCLKKKTNPNHPQFQTLLYRWNFLKARQSLKIHGQQRQNFPNCKLQIKVLNSTALIQVGVKLAIVACICHYTNKIQGFLLLRGLIWQGHKRKNNPRSALTVQAPSQGGHLTPLNAAIPSDVLPSQYNTKLIKQKHMTTPRRYPEL